MSFSDKKSTKEVLKQASLDRCPSCYERYRQIRIFIENLLLTIRCVIYDMKQIQGYMRWGRFINAEQSQLQARLLFYFHKIEKGLCMPGPRRMFGKEAFEQICRLVVAWEEKGFSKQDPIYLGALDSLAAYQIRLNEEQLDPNKLILPKVSAFLVARAIDSDVETPRTPVSRETQDIDASKYYDELCTLFQARRSYRDFAEQPVSRESIDLAVGLAQQSPSACNRQPWRVYVVSDESARRKLLSLQNGNAGFGHLAPQVLAITTDMRGYFDASERHLPYVDGGLFCMSLILALQSMGIVSCCLNWCVYPESDRKAHGLLNIPDAERVVMLIAIGYPKSCTLVPKSERKQIASIVCEI